MTRSTLRFDDGLLSWQPVGLPRHAPGSTPFRLPVGPGAGQVQELVWVSGTVALAARGGVIHAGALALCCSDAGAPGGRRVLAFLPEALISLPSGPDPVPDRASARAHGQAIADSLGVPFSVHEVQVGEDPNRLFPGVMRHGRLAVGVTWMTSLIYLVSGGALSTTGGYWVVRGQWLGLLLLALGVAMCGLGAMVAPPLFKRLRRQ